MTPADYDAWYDTPRGAWIGNCEYALAHRLVALPTGASLLDVGCGTGWFTRRFARAGYAVTGVDVDLAALDFARRHDVAGTRYEMGDACALPYPDGAFEASVSMAALCFTRDEKQAVREMLRVSRRRVVIGWLNRHSLLYARKGTGGGKGAYRGARWYDANAVRALFDGLPVSRLVIRCTVFLPGGGRLARCIERGVPARLPWGSLLVVVADRQR